MVDRRSFLTGVVTCGTLSAAAAYLLRPQPRKTSVRLKLKTGADATGVRERLIGLWNQANPDIQVEPIPINEAAEGQHDAMLSAAEEGTCDILNLDIIDIPEFADKKLLTPIHLDDYGEFLGEMLKVAEVPGKKNEYYAVPFNTDVGMLFSRDSSDPVSLRDVLREPGKGPRLIAQLQPTSEAFVVNVLEHALAQDDTILDRDGRPSFELEKWKQALAPLRDALKDDLIIATETEDESLTQFAEGGVKHMRNWPVKYRDLRVDNDKDMVAGRIQVSPLEVSVLGGQSLAVAAKSSQRDLATDVVKFLTSLRAQEVLATSGLAPTRRAAYQDPHLRAVMPHFKAVPQAVKDSVPRPIHPGYREFSEAVQTHVGPFLNPKENRDLTRDFTDAIRAALS